MSKSAKKESGNLSRKTNTSMFRKTTNYISLQLAYVICTNEAQLLVKRKNMSMMRLNELNFKKRILTPPMLDLVQHKCQCLPLEQSPLSHVQTLYNRNSTSAIGDWTTIELIARFKKQWHKTKCSFGYKCRYHSNEKTQSTTIHVYCKYQVYLSWSEFQLYLTHIKQL